MERNFKWIIAGAGIMLVSCAVFGVVVMLLWNALMPQIFAFPQINYLQAAGLLILARLLFGGISGGLRNHAGHRGAKREGQMFHQGNKIREKWMSMSEDERKEFIEKEKDFFKYHKNFSPFREFFNDLENHKKEDDNE